MCDIGTRNKESVFFKQLGSLQNQYMKTETCLKLVSDVAAFRPRICISGVEPLLHPELESIIDVIKSRRLYLSLSTNGILLEQHAGMLANSSLDEIVVSIDGTEDVHDSIRGQGVYRKVLNGLISLKQAKAENPHSKLCVIVNYCINDRNCGSLTDFARVMIGLEGIYMLSFTFMYFVTEGASNAQAAEFHDLGQTSSSQISGISLSSIDTDRLWEQIREINKMPFPYRISFNIDMPSPETLHNYFHAPEINVGKKRCLIPWNRATILHNGDCIIHNRCIAYKTGNILEMSFNKMWNGPAYRAFRTRLKKAGLFPVCARCCGVIANA
jgi:MoaA/NifB/PqqE/SkfB family radical SAM enzyme